MMPAIEKFEEGLKNQLSNLADEIRSSEAKLLTLKENYLKVQGAVEILDLLKKESSEEGSTDKLSDEEAVTAVAEVF